MEEARAEAAAKLLRGEGAAGRLSTAPLCIIPIVLRPVCSTAKLSRARRPAPLGTLTSSPPAARRAWSASGKPSSVRARIGVCTRGYGV